MNSLIHTMTAQNFQFSYSFLLLRPFFISTHSRNVHHSISYHLKQTSKPSASPFRYLWTRRRRMLLTNIDFPTHFRKTKWSNTHNFAHQSSSNRKCQLSHLNYHQYDRVSQLFSITFPDLANYLYFFIQQTNHTKSYIGEQSEQKISKIGLLRDRTTLIVITNMYWQLYFCMHE